MNSKAASNQQLYLEPTEASAISIIAVSAAGLVQGSPARFVHDGGESIHAFAPGWQPQIIYAGLKPLHLLLFAHEQQGPAIWYLNEAMERQGDRFDELPPDIMDIFSVAAASLFGTLWSQLVIGQHPPALPEAVLSFFVLPLPIRQQLLAAYLSQTDITTLYHSINNPSGLPTNGKLINAGGRRVLLQPPVMHQLFDPHFLQIAYARLLQTGVMTVPSPVDGHEIQATHCFVLAPNSFAYRAFDARNNLTFYIIGDETWFRTACIYVPEAQLALALDPDRARVLLPDLGRTIFQHVIQHGDNLLDYLQRPAERVRSIFPTAMHLGHIIWQDISGIGQLVDRVSANRLPNFHLFDNESGPEMYGPLDEIFPELQGRVIRETGSFVEAVPAFYQDGVLAIRASAISISRAVRERVIDAIWRNPIHAQQIAQCASVRRPIIILGLRTEGRTLVDLIGFYERLVAYLVSSTEVKDAMLVVDGHNAHPDDVGKLLQSTGEHNSSLAAIGTELAILAAIQHKASGSRFSVVSTIGHPLVTSLIWATFCNAFVAPWGAGLAKYRWICNKPGFVITSKWNLQHRTDLHIYSAPEIMEDPAPIEFVDPAHVRDQPDAPLLIPVGGGNNPSNMNFEVDEPAVFQAIASMIGRYTPA